MTEPTARDVLAEALRAWLIDQSRQAHEQANLLPGDPAHAWDAGAAHMADATLTHISELLEVAALSPQPEAAGEAGLRAALIRDLWAWMVRVEPFLSAVLVMADDKTPGLTLLADVPALRTRVLSSLAAPALPTGEAGLDVERLAEAEYNVDQGNQFNVMADALDWAKEVAAEYDRLAAPALPE